LRALEALRALEGGASWSSAVADYNDAADDALGRVTREELTPSFAEAAFSLEVDQLSYVVETDRGFHVILRER
jgi:parvulin-like peptidyl-prolyl isomerase